MEKNYLGGCITWDNHPELGKGDIATWAPQVWDKLIEVYQPKSIMDVGCGAGFSTEYFIKKGIETLGIEGLEEAINSSSVKEFILKHDFVEGEYTPKKIFDLIWCCEFVEHVEEKYSQNFLNTFSKSKVIAMTHAVPGQLGWNHVNCQPSEYWIEKLNNMGFIYNKNFSEDCRNLLSNHKNGQHIKNNLLIFERK